MNVQRYILCLAASAAAFGLSPTPACAGSFSISPLRAVLSASAQTGSLTLRNQEATPVVVQAEVMLWQQADGQDQLTPSRDVLVSPAVFTLPGNGSQLVRVALRRPADPQRELSYRLILTEVPQQAMNHETMLPDPDPERETLEGRFKNSTPGSKPFHRSPDQCPVRGSGFGKEAE